MWRRPHRVVTRVSLVSGALIPLSAMPVTTQQPVLSCATETHSSSPIVLSFHGCSGACLMVDCAALLRGSITRGLSTRAFVSTLPLRQRLGGHYRPFSPEDEVQLATILTTKPRHVARHIRQSMQHSRRRIIQFRNAVTYLMILLQSRLQRREIGAADATAIVESLMRECVELRQGDMAHLLFRAAIRFRKYGLTVGYPLVRHLYHSYKHDNAKELMRGMADEMRGDAALRFIAVLAYLFCEQVERAQALLAEIPRVQLTTDNLCALAESYGSAGQLHSVSELADEMLQTLGESATEQRTHANTETANIDAISSSEAAAVDVSHTSSHSTSVDASRGATDTTTRAKLVERKDDGGVVPDDRRNNHTDDASVNMSVVHGPTGGNGTPSANKKTMDNCIIRNDSRNDLVEGAVGGSGNGCVDGSSSSVQPADEVPDVGVDADRVISHCLVALSVDETRMEDLLRRACECDVHLTDTAVGAVLRARLQHPQAVHCVADVYALEQNLRRELRRETLGIHAETAVIAKCSEVMARSHEAGDAVMLQKIEHLQLVVDQAIANDQLDDLDPFFLVSMIRGYGVLGQFEAMRKCFDALQVAGVVKDHRLHDEMLRWYAHAYNLKEVIALKEEMTAQNVYHTAQTYHHVFRVLNKYYPRMVEKYVTEMRSKGMALEGFMYPTLIRVFGELQDHAMVRQLYEEAKHKATLQGQRGSFSAGVVIQMLRVYRGDRLRSDAVVGDAESYGLLAHEAVQAEVAHLYSTTERQRELRELLARLPHTSPDMYRVLLRDAARRKDRAGFQRVLDEMQRSGVVLHERVFSVIITALARFNDVAGVRRYIHQAVESDCIRTPLFFADAASAFARLGDAESVDHCWSDLLRSKLVITMPVYNRFLELYLASNHVRMIQEILDTMMKLIPPNPITATTVVDMLGKMGRFEEMEAVLQEMSRSTNASPTLVTYHQAMHAYAKAADVTQMERIRERLQLEGFRENAVTYNILFDGYGRAKRYERLAELVQERRSRGVAMEDFGYVVLLNIYARGRMLGEIETVVEEMVSAGVHFSSRMLATIASSFSAVGNVPQMEHYISLLLSHPECRPRDVESVFLIYARLRDTVKLQELLDTAALPKSEFTYNLCVSAFARAGEHGKVAFLLNQMESKGFGLSRSASVTLSTLLLKAGKLELAQTVLKWKGLHPVESAPASGDTTAACATTTTTTTADEKKDDCSDRGSVKRPGENNAKDGGETWAQGGPTTVCDDEDDDVDVVRRRYRDTMPSYHDDDEEESREEGEIACGSAGHRGIRGETTGRMSGGEESALDEQLRNEVRAAQAAAVSSAARTVKR